MVMEEDSSKIAMTITIETETDAQSFVKLNQDGHA